MNATRTLAFAALSLAFASSGSAATQVRDPGQYPARVVVDTSRLPLPVAGLPVLGPNVYAGTLTIREEGTHVEARFQGTDVDTGDPLTVRCRFSSSWSGLTLDTVRVGGREETDVVTGLDGDALILMKVNGVGRVDGFAEQVLAELGSGPSLVRWTVR